MGRTVTGTSVGVTRVTVGSGVDVGSGVAVVPPEGDRQAVRKNSPIKSDFFI